MDTTINNNSINQNTLIWAIICSFLLHVMFAVVVPKFNFDLIKDKPTELTIELVKPKAPEPAPVVALRQIEPEAIKPEPIKKVIEPKPIDKPLPKIIPKAEPITEPQANEVPQVEQPPAIIATTPKADTPVVISVPTPLAAPEKPLKIEPNEQDISSALSAYGNTLGRAISKHKSYPKIAQMRGWQGECLLNLQLDSNSNVQSASIKESSGFESLDKQALEMARKASPFPAPPEALRGRSFNITVPVSFKLE